MRMGEGFSLIVWGLFKKIVVADSIAIIVNQVYNQPTHYSGVALAIATVCFAFQIYCDFSGYSDIAIGAALVMGFDLMNNFDRPYSSRSVAEFWKRWHISLSSWFQDYLYISLGGRRVSVPRWYFNLLVVFVVSGAWHGANWTFVAWGALHGLFLIGYHATKKIRTGIFRTAKNLNMEGFAGYLSMAFTFSLVCFAWIFFRANSIADALYIVRNLFGDWSLVELQRVLDIMEPTQLILVISALGLLELVQIIQKERSIPLIIQKQLWLKPLLYFFIIASLVDVGHQDTAFIYFQF